MSLAVVEVPDEELSFIEENSIEFEDKEYTRRREEIRDLAIEYRKNPIKLPDVEYTEEENWVWEHVIADMDELHEKYASKIYLEGKRLLDLPKDRVPQISSVNDRLFEVSGFRLAPIEGIAHPRTFLRHIGMKIMLTTQYVRPFSRPTFSPEPDVIHEMIGHVPLFADKGLAEFCNLLRDAVENATEEQMSFLERVYWHTNERGLILENGEIKALGGALMSSSKDMKHAFSDEVRQIPFEMDKVIQTGFDDKVLPEEYFVLPSVEFLIEETKKLIASFRN